MTNIPKEVQEYVRDVLNRANALDIEELGQCPDDSEKVNNSKCVNLGNEHIPLNPYICRDNAYTGTPREYQDWEMNKWFKPG